MPPVDERGAQCQDCNRYMRVADGCIVDRLQKSDGKFFERIRYGMDHLKDNVKNPIRCHDCAATLGHFHHFGCDWEECPVCEGQLITCGCFDDSSVSWAQA